MTVKAIVHDRYGDSSVLHLTEIDKPVAGPDEILVRTQFAAIHPGDWLLMTGRPPLYCPALGFRRPNKCIPGFDVAGTVEEIGDAVLTELIENGQLKPVIGRTYPLAETADAMDDVGGGHARGEIAVAV